MKQTPMFLMLLLATAMSGTPGSGGSRAGQLDDETGKKRSPPRDASTAAEEAEAFAPVRIRPAA